MSLRLAALAQARAMRRGVRAGIACAFTTAAFVLIGGNATALACPVCFGAEETSMIEGTKLMLFALLGITLTVQGAFVGFFLYLRHRAKRNAEMELETEWSELQRATR